MSPLDDRRDDETARECIERWERITGLDYGIYCADWLDARVANSPRTFHPTSHDLPRIHPRDAARQAAHGYSVDAELREVGPEPSDLLPDPADWINIVRSGNIPPHDGRRCPECGYPLTEAHADGHRPGWLLCPVCDTYNTGEDES